MSTEVFCRLCANLYPIHRVKNIEKLKADKLDAIILKLLEIEISEHYFTKVVCMSCCYTIMNFHKYLGQVKTAQVKLSEIIENQKNIGENELKISSFASIVSEAVENEENDITNSPKVTRTHRISQKRLDTILSKYLWKCTKCEGDFTFENTEDLGRHFDKVHECPAEYFCIECSECMTNLEEFRQHVLDHEESLRALIRNGKQIICNICQKVFPGRKNFIIHRAIHIGIKQFACQTCGKRFMQKPHLRSHTALVHNESTPYSCPKCNKKFKTKSTLQSHSQSHVPKEERYRVSCDICDKKFLTNASLKYHKLIHAGTHEYTCEHCGKCFTLKGNLQEHVLTHSTSKPFHCDQCPRAFKNIYRLKQHQIIHSEDKPYECEVCNAKFRKKPLLMQHLTIHTGELPFECSKCQRKFRVRKNLVVHFRQHTGEKPYHCQQCDHYFTSSGNYHKHMKCRHPPNIQANDQTLNND